MISVFFLYHPICSMLKWDSIQTRLVLFRLTIKVFINHSVFSEIDQVIPILTTVNPSTLIVFPFQFFIHFWQYLTTGLLISFITQKFSYLAQTFPFLAQLFFYFPKFLHSFSSNLKLCTLSSPYTSTQLLAISICMHVQSLIPLFLFSLNSLNLSIEGPIFLIQ